MILSFPIRQKWKRLPINSDWLQTLCLQEWLRILKSKNDIIISSLLCVFGRNNELSGQFKQPKWSEYAVGLYHVFIFSSRSSDIGGLSGWLGIQEIVWSHVLRVLRFYTMTDRPKPKYRLPLRRKRVLSRVPGHSSVPFSCTTFSSLFGFFLFPPNGFIRLLKWITSKKILKWQIEETCSTVFHLVILVMPYEKAKFWTRISRDGGRTPIKRKRKRGIYLRHPPGIRLGRHISQRGGDKTGILTSALIHKVTFHGGLASLAAFSLSAIWRIWQKICKAELHERSHWKRNS